MFIYQKDKQCLTKSQQRRTTLSTNPTFQCFCSTASQTDCFLKSTNTGKALYQSTGKVYNISKTEKKI
jgi:hypothetical protein